MTLDPKHGGFATYEARMSMAPDIVRMYYTMNRRTYDERIWHRMRLDQPQLWTIKHVAGQTVDSEKSHNWHIHGYHFQVDHAVDAYNNTYTESSLGDWRQGDWRDTISVPRDGHVVVRFVPHTYAGLILHHCHVYNHETGGLKEMVDCSTAPSRPRRGCSPTATTATTGRGPASTAP